MTAKEAIDVLFNEWKCIDRNDGIHCDRKCETCDLVMDVGIIREAFNMAISALEAQELSKNSPELDKENGELATDCISRQAAIDSVTQALKRTFVEYEDIARTIIGKLPSAQPEPQWIPVSERLPGENEFVLVTFGWFGRKTDPGVNIDEIKDGDWMISEVVTAWMPLPEPYRVERRNDE